MSHTRPAAAHAPMRFIACALFVARSSLLCRVALCALCAAACAALVGAHAAAASFDDYRTRVNIALNHAIDLRAALADEDGVADLPRAAGEIAALRAALPQRERVESANGAVEADNGWLYKELEAYDAAPATEIGRRREVAARLVDRLGALNRELDATAAAASAAARDKEAEKGRLQTILRRPEYNEAAARGTAAQSLWERIKEFLRRLIPKPKSLSPGLAGPLSVAARLFVYALAVAIVVFVVWRFGPGAWARISARRRASHESGARVVLGETLAPGETASDLIDEAERLARAGELRGAIRKAYIAVLCELGDRKVIRLAQHKTNRDYLAGVRDHAEIYGTLRPLTHSFERHWYGFAPATSADWDEYRALCHQAIRS